MPKKKEKLDNKFDTESKSKIKSLYVLKRLIKYIGTKNRIYIYPLIILVSLNVILSWFAPLIFRKLVDDGLGGGIGSVSGDLDLIIILGTLFFIFTIAGVLTRIGQGYIIQKLATLTMYNLREELFFKFQKLELDYHESIDKTAGKKISYLTNDVNTIQELIQSGLLMVIGNLFLVFGALGFMIILSPQLTLVSFIITPVIFIIGGGIFKKARKYFKELRERVAKVTSELDESILGMKVIQAFAVEEENFNEFNDATQLERKTTLKTAKLMAFVPGIITFIITTGIGALFFTAGVLIREGLITQGTLVAFIFYIFMFFEPLISLVSFFTLVQNSIAAGDRIIKLLDEEISIKETPNAIQFERIQGRIDINNVNFEYEQGVPVLKNINIKVKGRERLALVGYTGAGKSTLIKLLCRFYDPIEGNIEIDGINLKDVKISNLRHKMGIVLQENFLFSGTVMENIRYGKLDANEEEIIETAKKVKAHDMIMKLENTYDTIVGERGSKLSEGQRQLIAFARALIADPPILILDEATSSIDPYSELLIQQALETLLKGRTSISIAHRLSTIINSDRIIVLDKGKIIEEGSHQELLQKQGLYKHLYEMQFKDPFKKETPDKLKDLEDVELDVDAFYDKDRFSRFF
jgi:ABC-type multidrug transport system fused ATPase/permease subunit